MRKRFLMLVAALAVSATPVIAMDTPGGMLFNGHLAASNSESADITINGSFTDPLLLIQISNPSANIQAISCVVDQPSEIVDQTNAQIGGPADDVTSGIVTLHGHYCYITATGKNSSFTPISARFTLNWHYSDSKMKDRNLSGATANVQLPNIDAADGFSGVGTLTHQQAPTN